MIMRSYGSVSEFTYTKSESSEIVSTKIIICGLHQRCV